MAEFIEKTDTLNEGREKINAAIQDAEDAKMDARQAVNVSEQAKQIAQTAENKADNVQEQFNQVVIEGDSSVEAAQARVDAENNTFSTLKERLDTKEVQFTSQLAQTENKMFYDSLGSARKRKPIMTIVDDDGKKEFYELIKPILEEFRVPIASALITSVVGTDDNEWMNESQIKELHKLGAEFVSHTHTHVNLSELYNSGNIEKIQSECQLSRDWLLKRGYNADTIVYPFGQANYGAINEVAKYFRFGVKSDGSGNHRINTVPIASWEIQRVYIDYGVELVKQKIDETIANNGWIVLGMHVYYENFNVEDLREVIQYALSKNVEIVSFEEAISYIGNHVELGTTFHDASLEGVVIDANGEVHGAKVGRYRTTTWNNSDKDKKLNDFPFDVRIVGHVRSSESQGFPENLPGYFEVIIPRNHDFAHQIYTVLQNDRIYKRKWDTTTGDWTEWYLLYDKKPKIVNAGSLGDVSNTSIYDFESNAITRGFITDEDAINMPEGKGGFLETHRIVGDRYNFQIYRVYGSGNVYLRWRSYSPSRWLEWHKISNPLAPKLERLVDIGTVPANSTKDIQLDFSTITSNSFALIKPRSGIAPGLIWNYWIEGDRTLNLRIANITNQNIGGGSVVFEVIAVNP